MYIKTLTIQGFKSYRDQTQMEPFSPRHNVVVGRNGSGKSNFFAAIRFVLSDAYMSMTKEDRQALLHEGVSATTTLSAFVEIVFDNSDNRFPTGHEEVILRRTIGLKKDEYSLDKKSASKADVMNLLESAGFSRANPYYIVPQGRITALTNAKDHERLALLKEVAGTKVYEQRRSESLRIMSETDAKRSKINELLDYIESRLSELEDEKEELMEFQDKDKERRCLEYALYQRELEEVGEALVDIEEERRVDVHGANVRREKFNEREKEVSELEKAASEVNHILQTLALSRQEAQAELTDLVRTRTELECTIADLRTASASAGGKRDELEKELIVIDAKIGVRETELEELIPQWTEQRATDSMERRGLDDVRGQLDALFAKQGRASKFRSKRERDEYLTREIASMNVFQRFQTMERASAQVELNKARRSLGDLDAQITHIQDKVDDGRRRGRELAEQAMMLREKQAEMSERRKELWKEDAKLDSLVGRAADELNSAERTLAAMMDKETSSGLRAVDQIAQQYGFTGVYGPLNRLFEVMDPKFNMAIELTAGNSLFHVVADTDDTAAGVLDALMKEYNGRITFMPLNRLKPKNPPMPSAQDAEPLLSKMYFNRMYEKALQQVFGKTCVCRDLAVAAAYAKSHGINTITLDGDRVDHRGALTGGYHDVRRSRIEAIGNFNTWRMKLETEEGRAREVKVGIARIEQEMTQLAGQLIVLGGQQNKTREARERLVEEGTVLTKQKEEVKQRIEMQETNLYDLETELAGLEAKLAVYAEELAGPFTRGLSGEEEELIARIGKEVERRQKVVLQLSKSTNELESRKNAIEIELNEHFRRRQVEIRAKLESLEEPENHAMLPDMLASRIQELKALNKSIDDLMKKTEEIEGETDTTTSRLQELRITMEQVQIQQSEDDHSISRHQKSTERYLAKRQMLTGRRDECNRNIRDLGVLPEEAFEKYIKEKLDRLVKKLHAVTESLKKFAHVNKKAFEQYSNFTKQRDQLLKRREDLEKSANSIEQLVEVLDHRKDEAIERTFKQVAQNFEEVFEKLVPAGRGRLIIQTRVDQDKEMDEEGDNHYSSIDNYTGISIKVSFNSKVNEGLRIQQLSGGQKSLVALATVFAIQKCDPAPFYLFDEIDANLDAQYRTAVAAMIHSMSSTAQFITTTFRSEMLVSAHQFFGVLFDNQKVSFVRTIKQEEAMEFVEQEAQAQ